MEKKVEEETRNLYIHHQSLSTVIHIPVPTTHTVTVATEPFHRDIHIPIATTHTTIVAGGVAASYRDEKGREPNKAEAAPLFLDHSAFTV